MKQTTIDLSNEHGGRITSKSTRIRCVMSQLEAAEEEIDQQAKLLETNVLKPISKLSEDSRLLNPHESHIEYALVANSIAAEIEDCLRLITNLKSELVTFAVEIQKIDEIAAKAINHFCINRWIPMVLK